MRGWASGLILLAACDEVAPTAPECSLPQENPQFIQLATDGYAVMALRSDGRAACWGTDRAGQCGLSMSGLELDAVLAPVPSCATWVGMGSVGSALQASGDLVVWGSEDANEFGDGPERTTSFGRMKRVPIHERVMLASLDGSALAVTEARKLLAWGCCDASGEGLVSPTQVSLKALPISLTTNNATCVVLDNGEVLCRSRNNQYGQVGDGTYEPRVEFTSVLLPSPAASIAGGVAFNCAALQSGLVACWGKNIWGNRPAESYPIPVTIEGIRGVSHVRVVTGFGGGGCAFNPGGQAACWGDGMSKLLPDTGGAPQLFTPFDDVLDMVLGQDGRGCVLRASDHWVYCAGELRGEIEDYEALEIFKPIPEPRIPKDDEK